MAGDWIPMRLDLAEDPAVMAMAEILGMPEQCVVGYLHCFWSWCSRQCETEHTGITPEMATRRLQLPNAFLECLIQVGWSDVDSAGCLVIPKWDRWLSASAKRRASTLHRVKKHRCGTTVTHERYTDVTDKQIVPLSLRRQVYERDGNSCVYCGRKHGDVSPNAPKRSSWLSVDHVIPESQGGATSADNLVTCCLECNQGKGDRNPDECGFKWPCDVTGKRYGCVTKALPEKRRVQKSTEEKSKKETPTPLPLPDELSTPEFQGAWTDWQHHRREIKKALTPTQTTKQLEQFAEWGVSRSVAAIRYTIRMGWQGLREPESTGARGPAKVDRISHLLRTDGDADAQ